MTDAPILAARGAARVFETRGGQVHALTDIDIACTPGTSLGVVGESGCGKTTLNRLLLGLDRPSAGAVEFNGRDIWSLTEKERRAYRMAVQPVFQNPYSSLNPRMKVGRIIAEPLRAAGGMSRRDVADRVAEVIAQVGLAEDVLTRLPAEFSGGQRQRIAIARAIASRPDLLLLDEPVSSQDVSIRAQILNLIKDLQAEIGMATMFVSHDLATVRFMCDEVVVVYLGRIVERGPAAKICATPDHPYTKALNAASLPADPEGAPADVPPIGEIPSPLNPPGGCPYHPRCPFAKDICKSERPAMKLTAEGATACHMVHSEVW